MDLTALWQATRAGTSSFGVALALALAAAGAALAVSFALLRPLARLFSRKDTEKVRQSRDRRITFGLVVASVALGVFLLLQAITPVEARGRRMAYGVTELVLILFAGYVTLEVLLGFFGDYLPRLRGRAPLAPIIKDLLRSLLLLGVFILGVKQAFPATDVGALVTTSAILSIVVGLALQESLSNVFAGIMLTIDRPYKPGDWIEFNGQEGRVLDSNWRSTRIQTRDDDLIYVPNSTMAKSDIVNLSDPTTEHLCRRKIGIEYSAPPNKVRSVLTSMMLHVDGVLGSPPPDVFVADYGDSAIVYELRFWIAEYDRRTRIESEVLRGVWYHLKREGISIPFPIRDVFLHRHKAEKRPEEVLLLLRRVDLLQPLKEEELVMLAEDLSHHLFAKGEAVCKYEPPATLEQILSEANKTGFKTTQLN